MVNLLHNGLQTLAVTALDPQPTGTEDDYTREREDDQQTGQWSDDLGEFVKPTVKASSKPAVIASVRSALEAIGRRGGKPGATSSHDGSHLKGGFGPASSGRD